MISSVLIWTVMLQLLTISQSCSEESLKNDSQRRCKECPPGYHALGGKAAAGYTCERCEDGSTFTAIQNHRVTCLECTTICEHSNQKVSKECVYNRDAECVCQDGYYPYDYDNENLNCLSCFEFDKMLPSDDCQRKECILHTRYQDHCNNSRKTSAAPIITSSAGGPSEGTLGTSKPTWRTPDPGPINDMMFVVIVVVVVAAVFLVCNSFMVVARILYPTGRSVASDDLESTSLGLKLTAQETLPPSTMTLNVCEDSPAMLLSQSPFAPAHPSHHHPLLRSMEAPALTLTSPPPPPPCWGGATGERWPAAVLYAVIQEVPLRRWKEFLRHLGVAEEQMERLEMEAGAACLGSREKQYQMLRLWTQRPATALAEVYASLHRMELAGCAQLLFERLATMGLGEGAE